MIFHQCINAFAMQAVTIANPTAVALVNRSTSIGVADGSAITWNNEVYDNEAVIPANNTTMTVPSDGLYRISCGAFTNTNTTGSQTSIDAAAVIGRYKHVSGTSTPRWTSGQSAILALTATNAVTSNCAGGLTDFAATYSFFGLERIASNLRYALVRKSADQTSFTSGKVTFATLAAGQADMFDAANSRVLIPVGSGISRVKLSLNYELGSQINGRAEITKNGSFDIAGLPSQRRTNAIHQNLCGPPINAAEGDYFEFQLALASSGTVKNATDTWLQIEEIPSGLHSCLVTQTGHDITTSDAAVSWDTEDHDTAGVWSAGDPTKLVVPSGFSYARLYFYIKGELSDTARVQAQVSKTGSAGNAIACDCDVGASGSHQRLCGASAWIPVTAGDYFRLVCSCDTGTVTTTGGYFGIELI